MTVSTERGKGGQTESEELSRGVGDEEAGLSCSRICGTGWKTGLG